ncbi:uncharacterized protein [Drosophila pseudoobscura]|uniref:Conotoxin n=1 Tax=Drosophila pseudoobscura pseudoobscura TaxID=46245 RepID=A0A6I8VNC9_DROPS|nr:uncharacterized protein LOC26533124 [Drosophila pseudoobscura]
MNSIVSILALILIGALNGSPVIHELQMSSMVKRFDGPLHGMGLDRKQGSRRLALMPLSKNLTEEERIEYSEICVGIGIVCHLAEQCCTKMCLKSAKRCTYVHNDAKN